MPCGLRIVFSASVVLMLIAAAASWMRGTKYVHEEQAETVIAEPEEWVPA